MKACVGYVKLCDCGGYFLCCVVDGSVVDNRHTNCVGLLLELCCGRLCRLRKIM